MTKAARILDRIATPDDVKTLNSAELTHLAAEIRAQLVTTVADTGGHLAPNLGVVELTLGIYRALDCPPDRVVFDVGHQSYVHKLLTGRRDVFHTLRTEGGISGFPKRSESPYDVFGSGHASDSLSIAQGLALARDAAHDEGEIVAVIGDGSLTGGMAWEALNHIGHLGTRMTIVLNDNEMSISPNVGALAGYLGRIRLDRRYWGSREFVQSTLERRGRAGRALVDLGTRIKDSFKHLIVPGMVFEEMGISYVGPLDGHDVAQVEAAIRSARDAAGPVIIHAVTQKGRGYAPAEANPTLFHGVGAFDAATGRPHKKPNAAPDYTKVFSDALIREADADPRIVALTAAMASGTGLDAFRAHFADPAHAGPTRFIDVGIAEEHATALAAGLAFGGRLPVVAIYSTFLQRAYDQIISDVALQGAHVVFALDRAGFVGEDGPTHHGLYDLSYLRSIPTMTILAPSDEAELVSALHTALALEGPVALRYPRGQGLGVTIPDTPEIWEYVHARVLRRGDEVALLAVGRMVGIAEAAAEQLEASGLSVTVADMRWVKPLDEDFIAAAAREHKLLVTLEENTLRGGFGSGVMEFLSAAGIQTPLLQLAVPDEFALHGTMDALLTAAGLDTDSVVRRVRERL